MKAISRRRIGSPYFYDLQTGLEISLPKDYLIFNYHRKLWLGGSKDGYQLLLIERIPTQNAQIPNILAEGDLNLFICSTGTKIEKYSDQISGIEMEGTYHDIDIKGDLIIVNISDQYSYLILIAEQESNRQVNKKEKAMQIANALLAKVAIAA